MRRSWPVLLVPAFMVLVASCGDSTPADVATDAAERTTMETDAPPTSAEGPPPASFEPSVEPDIEPSVEPSVEPDIESGVVPQGFGTIAARVTASDGEVCELCLWRADDASTRGRGLMQVTDLAGYDGMAFRYDAPHSTTFTMRNTVMPLSIAFFGTDGVLLDAFDMEPCVSEPCPRYPTPIDFVVAIEVPQGGLPDLGIGPGSLLELVAEGCVPDV